ncbi:MAG: fatty acid desaturase, partial [Armatimonadota bacterium]
KSLAILLAAGFVGALLLETINYIEHYGLTRKQLETGKFERVTDRHSWNSNHHIGRIVLYELTRHSDHHAIAGKPYQRLDHRDEAPQLPFGYPTSMLLAMVPPLWFRVMNLHVPIEMRDVS